MGLVSTLQSNIRVNTTNVMSDAYFLGGTNAKHNALHQYDFLRTGYGRIFILSLPAFVEKVLPDESAKFKHMLEYANVGIDGIQGTSVEFASVTGGYVGNTIEIPVNAKDDTNSITIKVYDTQGSLFREYIDFWITGTSDTFTGFSHYHGARSYDRSLVASQANQTMEALFVSTDQTGNPDSVEYSCLLTNMFPKGIDHSHFNYESGSHDVAQLSLEFTCVKYMSAHINLIGKTLVEHFKIMHNYLNMVSGYTTSWVNKQPLLDIHGWNTTPNFYSEKAVPVTEVATPA